MSGTNLTEVNLKLVEQINSAKNCSAHPSKTPIKSPRFSNYVPNKTSSSNKCPQTNPNPSKSHQPTLKQQHKSKSPDRNQARATL
jgi:hypothetical protein